MRDFKGSDGIMERNGRTGINWLYKKQEEVKTAIKSLVYGIGRPRSKKRFDKIGGGLSSVLDVLNCVRS